LDDTSIGLFAQDRWEIGSHWLLDYGLRYDLSTFTLPDSARVDSTVPNGGAGRDTDNIAPRIGFTYTPRADGRTLVRGGGGVFYDKLVLGFPAVASITSGTKIGIMPLQGLALEINEQTVERDGPLEELAFPPELILRFSTDTELETPYTVQFSLGVEQSIGKHGAARANLIHSLGYNIPLLRDFNPVVGLLNLTQGVDCPGDVDLSLETGGYPCHGPDPDTGSIAATTTDGRSWYWGLDLGYRLQTEHGWLSASYTLSKAEDLGFDPLKGGISLPPDSQDLSLERGRADGDRRHRVVISADSPLPFWGLRLSGVLQVSTGAPFNVTTGQDSNHDGIMTDRLEGERRNNGSNTSLDAINEIRADANKTFTPEGQLAPVTSLSEPRFEQIDLRLYKQFPLSAERGNGEVYFQVFNLLDKVNPGLIYGRANSPLFGTAITLAGPPRTVELGLRLTY
jgi:outer membrane receptor protein involved in Fe transport